MVFLIAALYLAIGAVCATGAASATLRARERREMGTVDWIVWGVITVIWPFWWCYVIILTFRRLLGF